MLDHPTLDQLKTLRLDGMAEAFALDLSRFRAAPSARLSHLSFESDRAFPTQCSVTAP